MVFLRNVSVDNLHKGDTDDDDDDDDDDGDNNNNNLYCVLLSSWHVRAFGGFQFTVNSLTLRLLMSYIYGAPILDVSRSHTTTQHSR